MTSSVALKTEAAPIVACTISRDVQNFDLLIEDMEAELGETWGDLSFGDALAFFGQPEGSALEFVAVAIDSEDERNFALVGEVIRAAKARKIKVIIVADEVGPMALHQLLKLGADGFCPYPLPEGALRDEIEKIRRPVPEFVHSAPAQGGTQTKSSSDRNGMILPVHGLGGGVGATTFAVNLAWELATAPPEKGAEKAKAPRVCLLDFDFQFGSVATYLDLPRREAVFELLSDTASMDAESFLAAMLPFNDKLHVLTAPAEMLPLDIVTPEDISAVLNMARSQFDFVIVDMPKAVVPWTETVLNAAHVYMAMIQLDMRSAQNTLRMLRALKAEELPFERLRFLLNRAPRFTDLSGKARAKRMAESLDIKIEVQLPDGGQAVSDSNDHGLPLAETAAKNPLRKETAKLAASLMVLAEKQAAEAR